MATNQENLETIRSNLLAKLAELSANPKPNYTVDGQTVAWGDYYAMLWSQLEKCNAQLAAEASFEIVTQGWT